MKFTLLFNNKKEEKNLPNKEYSINDLLKDLELSSQTIVAKINNEIVIEESLIKDNDEVQLIQIIYGG
ncbi:MoaD/ThiS family protein [Methanobrevibacter sp. DSM 116169]|uniref:MoaD/ThiS family protein n=1 Tax=Methanobrevibacter sp. DSM 116169 TaxID=3242727 RepID=UPI0038FC5FF6